MSRLAVVAAALALVGLAAALAAACAESRRSLGAQCLKSQDCLSGICSQFACAAAPPTIDAEENAEAASPEAALSADAGAETGLDASSGSDGEDAEAVEAAGGD
jgi:hypothetical protein